MGIRPFIEIITEYRSITNIWIALLTHMEAASAANIIIFFIYFQLNIIFRGSLGNKKICCIQNKGIILLLINIIQILSFFIGPFIYHYTSVKANVIFWIAVIIITITTIPFFSFLGLSLYFKINKMPNKRFKDIAKHILFMVILCSVVGGFTAIVAIFSIFNTKYESILVELCWMSNIYLNLVIFLILIRKKTSVEKSSVENSSVENSSVEKSSKKNKISPNSNSV
uniref:Uncharacterized protein n=1 Tax=Pithovirus LCPAC101 TaxID=2506586 RepID=A0A481Z278_9VIRU|nr:MAG: hypothetical protein LCPAC101_01300 [Pithovirus LCPAC101]